MVYLLTFSYIGTGGAGVEEIKLTKCVWSRLGG